MHLFAEESQTASPHPFTPTPFSCLLSAAAPCAALLYTARRGAMSDTAMTAATSTTDTDTAESASASASASAAPAAAAGAHRKRARDADADGDADAAGVVDGSAADGCAPSKKSKSCAADTAAADDSEDDGDYERRLAGRTPHSPLGPPPNSDDEQDEQQQGEEEEGKGRTGLGGSMTAAAADPSPLAAPSAWEAGGLGARLLKLAGYSGTGGLGKRGTGIIEPVRGSTQIGQEGLGFQAPIKRSATKRSRLLAGASLSAPVSRSPAAGGCKFISDSLPLLYVCPLVHVVTVAARSTRSRRSKWKWSCGRCGSCCRPLRPPSLRSRTRPTG